MMAANDCTPVTFYGTYMDAFCFDVSETVVDGDTFKDSGRSRICSLQCKDNKMLLLNAANQFQLRHLLTHEQCKPECKFTIRIYEEYSEVVGMGVPVMLYANKDGQTLMACCRENGEIYPEAMVLPEKIEDPTHRALFYLTQDADKYMFESSVYRSKFMGFTSVDGRPSLKKLTLRTKGLDGVDESSEATLHKCDG